MPGGNPLGKKGTGPRAPATVREVNGGRNEAERFFQELSQGGADVTPPGHIGAVVKLPGGRGTIGYRPSSKSGPPTIDVNVVDASGKKLPVEKIKFID